MSLFLLIGVCLVGVVFGSLLLFDRGEARRMAEWHEQQRAQIRETSKWLDEENKRRSSVYTEVNALKWPELRALCERETGRAPCECAKRRHVAENVFWARERRRS